jgi:hypothetical protein
MRTFYIASFLFAFSACGSSSSSGSGVVIDSVENAEGIQGKQAADGKYDTTVTITAHASGQIVSARIDFPSDVPAKIVGDEVAVNQKTLSSKAVTFRIAGTAGPGTGDANLVLTDDSGAVARKAIIVTMTP